MNKLILIFSFFIVVETSAQSRKERRAARGEKINALIKQEEEGVLIYKKHNIYGFAATTDGIGIVLEKGIRESKKKTTLYRIELFEKKHPKEERAPLSQSALGNINTGILFKLNSFYQLRLGYGMQYLIGSKGNKNGIEVSAVGVGGLTLGLAKPYLYDVGNTLGKRFRAGWEEIDTTANINEVFGASGFTTGWNKVKIKPGLFAKAGLRFDYGKYNEMVNAVDIGLFAEFYASKIPQIYLIKQKQFFIGAYLTILMGRRK
jgi:hypothetical protein